MDAGGVTFGPVQQISVAKYLQEEASRALAADGMKKGPQIEPGPISKFTSPRRTVNTSKYKVNLLPTLANMLPIQLWGKLNTIWMRPPLEHWQLTEANARLARKLEEHSKQFKEVKAFLKKDRAEIRGRRPFTPSLENYYWTSII
jgi:hypothetical protein